MKKILFCSLLIVSTSLFAGSFSIPGSTPPNGEISVYVKSGTFLKLLGSLEFSRFLQEKNIEAEIPAEKNTVELVLVRKGGGASHIDHISVDGRTPCESSLDTSKLVEKDYDVADIGSRARVVISGLEPENRKRLISIRARIESREISREPFMFPPSNTFKKIDPEKSSFYTYRFNSKIFSVKVDGEINDESAKLGAPLFNENIPVASGHPQNPSYAWVCNDEKNLYALLDFTADNTMDGDKDYAALYIKVNGALKEHRISLNNQKWGRVGFTYTDRAGYQHKVYEFKIPFKTFLPETGRPEQAELAFAAYGTASPGVFYPRGAFDSSRNRFLVTYVNVGDGGAYDVYGFFADVNGNPSGEAFMISPDTEAIYNVKEASIRAAYNRDDDSFLIVWLDYAAEFKYNIHSRIVKGDGTVVNRAGGTIISDGPSLNPMYGSLEYLGIDIDMINNPAGGADKSFIMTYLKYDGEYFHLSGQFIKNTGVFNNAIGSFYVDNTETFKGSSKIAYDSKADVFRISYVRAITWNEAYREYTSLFLNTVSQSGVPGTPVELGGGYYRPNPVAVDEFDGTVSVTSTYNNVTIDGVYILSIIPGVAGEDERTVIQNSDNMRNIALGFDAFSKKFLSLWYNADQEKLHWCSVDLKSNPACEEASIATANLQSGAQMVESYAVFNSYLNNFLVLYPGNHGVEPYEIVTGVAGNPSPVEGMFTDIVNPADAVSGTEFSFALKYWDGEAPESAELWIDFNGDGAFSENSFPALPTLPVMLIFLVLMASAALMYPNGVRLREAYFIVFMALSSVFMLYCSSDADKKGTEDIPEIHQMLALDADDSVYTDGRDYGAMVKIDRPGTYQFRYVFRCYRGEIVESENFNLRVE